MKELDEQGPVDAAWVPDSADVVGVLHALDDLLTPYGLEIVRYIEDPMDYVLTIGKRD